MRVYKTKLFHAWAEKLGLPDTVLRKAINELLNGLYDTNLGGNLYKKRMALKGRGKRGGARTIIACKLEDKAFFLYGFAKNKKANIARSEKRELLELGQYYLDVMTDEMIAKAVKIKQLIEVL